jgi:hypothetical protein
MLKLISFFLLVAPAESQFSDQKPCAVIDLGGFNSGEDSRGFQVPPPKSTANNLYPAVIAANLVASRPAVPPRTGRMPYFLARLR